jgi:ATP-binding cassette, subfamily C, bacterial LapB
MRAERAEPLESPTAASPRPSASWRGLPLPEKYRRRAFRASAAWQLLIALYLNILSLAVPIMMLQVYDRIIPHQALGTLTLLLVGVGVALAIDAALRVVRAYVTSFSAASQEHAANTAALDHLARVDLGAFSQDSSGVQMQRLAALGRLREFQSGQALSALIDLPFASVFLLMIYFLGGKLVFVPLGMLALFVLVSRYAGWRLRKALEFRADSDDRKFSFIISVLTGIHTAKSLGAEALLMRRFEREQVDVTRSSYDVARASGFAATLSAGFSQSVLIFAGAYGALLVIDGELSVGALSACSFLAGRALQPVQRVLGTWLRYQDYGVSRQQADALFGLPVQLRTEQKLNQPSGAILLQNVTLVPAHGNAPRFTELFLKVDPGEIVAIRGEKGTGKSALLQLIAGILVPSSGTISVDGMDPAQHGLSELHAHIGYLPQQGAIFRGTILENLTGFTKDESAVESAKASCRQLGLDAVIDQLPKGYFTQLFDTPADPIPPGVKQRIAIARVLRRQPSILLFDDADRNLDKEGYNRLFSLMGRLKGRTTIVLVTADQNLTSFADRTYRLAEGKLEMVSAERAETLSFANSRFRPGAVGKGRANAS